MRNSRVKIFRTIGNKALACVKADRVRLRRKMDLPQTCATCCIERGREQRPADALPAPVRLHRHASDTSGIGQAHDADDRLRA